MLRECALAVLGAKRALNVRGYTYSFPLWFIRDKERLATQSPDYDVIVDNLNARKAEYSRKCIGLPASDLFDNVQHGQFPLQDSRVQESDTLNCPERANTFYI